MKRNRVRPCAFRPARITLRYSRKYSAECRGPIYRRNATKTRHTKLAYNLTCPTCECVFCSVNARARAHTWPSRNRHVRIGECYEAQSPLLYIPDACKDLCLSRPSVCALYTGSRRDVYRTYTDAPPITLTCKYVICSSGSRYTWLHSVTSTDIESLQPGLYSSKAKRYRHRRVHTADRCRRTHTHARRGRRITSRLAPKVERPKPIIAVAGDTRPDAMGSKWKQNKPRQFSPYQ